LLAVLLLAGCGTSVETVVSDPNATVAPDVPDRPPVELPPVTPPPASDELQTLLAQLSDPATRLDAATKIHEQGDEAVEHLIAMLSSDSWQARAGAIFALGLYEQQAAEALPSLRLLAEGDPHEAVRDAAAFAVDAVAE